ncbi:hypothetical protein D9757_004801 [Collybiopsis confluens]|uniref:DUF6699 domain-containing protein n=1 Tax=Collybiopsis confluens TaxID=2823264 RepID=A0A8H5HSJ6_9AGAR|nr:hypothetical protein D9757_004801 [Collybiopsis confluens]
MAGYYSGTDVDGFRTPRKPSLKSVELPLGSPLNSPTVYNGSHSGKSRSSWMPWSHFHRSQTPAPPASQRRDSSFHEVPMTNQRQMNAHNSTRTRKLSGSSNVSDHSRATTPLKGILKKPGSLLRPPTPAPSTMDHVPASKAEMMSSSKAGSEESSNGRYYHHRKASSSSSSSKIDGYSSESHTALWKRKLSSDDEALKSSLSGDAIRKPVGGYRKVDPCSVPMKAEAIALNWPLTEPSRHSRKQRMSICFDVAFDPRKPKGVTVPISTDVGHRMDMPYDAIRLPASTHCTLTEMRFTLDQEEFKCWPIKVKRKEGVRCLDVFEAIYKTLQHRLTDEDVRTFGEARIQRCYSFCLQRCIDSPGLPDYNKQYGMRRVDLLRGRRFFRGIVQSGDDWILCLDDYSGSSRP